MRNDQQAIDKVNNLATLGNRPSWRVSRLLAGVGLVVLGTSRRSISGMLIATIGTMLTLSSLLEFGTLKLPSSKRRDALSESPQTDDAPWDRVDEASWESFPSSDPPAIP